MSGNPSLLPAAPPGPSLSQFLAILTELVNATNNQATVIKSTAITGAALSGDVTGSPAATVVIATHLSSPLSQAQGGTGNSIGQPSGTAGGDLGSSYPNPQVVATHLASPLPLSQGGLQATTAAGGRATLGVPAVTTPTTAGNVAVFTDAIGTIANGGIIPALVTGTWTPALALGGISIGITYSVQHGTYTQIGRMVFCFFTLTLSAISGSGAATLTGLPFTSNADVSNAGAGGLCPHYANMATLSGVPLIQVGAASSVAGLLGAGAAATVALTDANFTSTTTLAGSFSYFT